MSSWHPILESTLEAVARAPGYHRWLAACVAPYLEAPVLEIGAGLGGFTRALCEVAVPILASEPDPGLANELRRRFSRDGRVMVTKPLELPLSASVVGLSPLPKTVVLANVLEHIDDDIEALRSIMLALPSVQRVVLVVPAHGWAYSPVDSALGHHRRYTTDSLRRVVEMAGWAVYQSRYFNPIGALAWAVSGRVLGRSNIALWQARVVEALVPFLRLIGGSLRGRWLGQSAIAYGYRMPLASDRSSR